MGYTLQNVRYLSILITVAAVIATIHRAGACNVELLISTTALTLCYAKSLQSCPTLCDPIDGSPPGSPVPGILRARTLEWVAIFFSNAGKWKVKGKSLSHVRLFTTPWTAAYQAPPSMGFSRQECWSGMPLPSPCEFLLLSKMIQLYTYMFFQIFFPSLCLIHLTASFSAQKFLIFNEV